MATRRISRIWWTILLTIAIFSFSLPTHAKYSGGTGDPNDPYQIATAEDLMLLGDSPDDYDKHFIMIDDIDLDPNLPGRKVFDRAVIAPDTNDAIHGFQGIGFTGVFGGNGYKIWHLTIKGGGWLGLFGVLGSGEVKYLELVDVNIIGSGSNIGGLVGENVGGVLTDCYVNGIVSGDGWYIGGLVGKNSSIVTQWCHSTVSVSGGNSVGGLVGNNDGSIAASYSTGTVGGDDCVGGLVGSNYGLYQMRGTGSITESYSSGSVRGNNRVGGLVGCNYEGNIAASYSSGSIKGNESVGGLVGSNVGEFGIGFGPCGIIASYSSSPVNGTNHVGGLVGFNSRANIVASYSSGEVSGTGDVGGLVGSSNNFIGRVPEDSFTSSFWDIQTSGQAMSAGGTGKTTAEMQTATTFLDAGWDFVGETANGIEDFWWILEGHDYPRLTWESTLEPNITPEPIDWLEGLGTAEVPYRIATADQLIRLGKERILLWNRHFVLDSDINLDPNLPSGRVFELAVFPAFNGVFDGRDHKISNLTIVGEEYLGFFGRLGPAANVSRLSLEAVNVKGTASDVGGLVGYNGGSVVACYITGTVSGNSQVGGLVGYNGGSITTSYSTGTVSGECHIGGLVGYNGGSISTSFSTGFVSGDERVGGLLGRNNGRVTTSYSTATANGDLYIGAFVGDNWVGSVTHCYCTGAVSGGNVVGGLVGGSGWPPHVIYSFWDVQTTGWATSGGGTGLTTAEMQTASTFLDAGWDFIDEISNGTEDIWWILEGQDYPRLWWELVPEN